MILAGCFGVNAQCNLAVERAQRRGGGNRVCLHTLREPTGAQILVDGTFDKGCSPVAAAGEREGFYPTTLVPSC